MEGIVIITVKHFHSSNVYYKTYKNLWHCVFQVISEMIKKNINMHRRQNKHENCNNESFPLTEITYCRTKSKRIESTVPKWNQDSLYKARGPSPNEKKMKSLKKNLERETSNWHHVSGVVNNNCKSSITLSYRCTIINIHLLWEHQQRILKLNRN